MLSNYIPKIEEWKEFFESVSEELIELNKKIDITNSYPEPNRIFKIFELCQPKDIKVIILGQDPYPTKGVANGLAFSVSDGIKVPQSLAKIYKALFNDKQISETPTSGNLELWVKQGVFLLNTALTIGSGKQPHMKHWKNFIGKLLKFISDLDPNIILVMWGNHAKCYDEYNFKNQLKYSHPSPLSGIDFGECKHFSQINRILKKDNKEQINWKI